MVDVLEELESRYGGVSEYLLTAGADPAAIREVQHRLRP
jgi:hypothetical protein